MWNRLGRLSLIALLLTVFVLVTKPVKASITWEQIGPDGAEVKDLVIDPQNPQTIYSGTFGGGIYKSLNGGTSWSAINNGLNGRYIYDMVIDPLNSQTIYSGIYGGVYKSTNGGDSWSASNNGLTTMIEALAIDPSNSQIIYAGSNYDVYKSIDGGQIWVNLSNGQLDPNQSYVSIESLTVDPFNSETIYAGTNYGVYKSTDGGASWAQLSGQFTHWIYDVVVDPSNSQIIYAGASAAGLLKSTDGGNTWSVAYNPLQLDPIRESIIDCLSIILDPKNNQNIYFGSKQGVFKSTDSGNTWIKLNYESNDMEYVPTESLAIDPIDGQTLYAGTLSGVFKWSVGDISMHTSNIGLSNFDVLTIVHDPSDNQVIYTGIGGAGVQKSTDGGATWNDINNGLYISTVKTIVVDPVETQIIYAAGDGSSTSNVFKSLDGGNSWSSIGEDIGSSSGFFNSWPYAVSILLIDPLNRQTLYAGTNNGVYKSVDSGISWSHINNGLNYPNSDNPQTIDALVIDPSNSQTLYAGTSEGIYRTSNGGSSWTMLSKDPTNSYFNFITLDPQNSEIMYWGNSFGISKSTDGGLSWKDTSNGMDYKNINFLVVDPSDSRIIYAGNGAGTNGYSYGTGIYVGSASSRLYKSVTSGESWTRINNILTYRRVMSIAIDPDENSTVLVGAYNGGAIKGTSSPVDTTPPTVSVYPNPGGYNTAQKVTLAADKISTIYYTLDGSIPTTSSTIYSNPLIFIDNTTLKYFAVDEFGNSSTYQTAVYTISDALPPTVSASPSGGTYGEAQIVTLSANEISTIYYTLDGTAPTTNSEIYSGPILISKPTTLNFFAVDLSGNIAFFDEEDYLFDTTPPETTINSKPFQVTPSTTAIFTFASSESDSNFECSLDNSEYSYCGIPSIYNPLGSGSHIFSVRAIDAYGNVDPTPAYYTWSVDRNLTSTTPHLWQKIYSLNGGHVRAIAIDPSNPQVLYAGTNYGGIFKTYNGGTSWESINNGLTLDILINSIVIDPSNPQIVYVGSYKGLYKTTDGGDSWAPIDNGLPDKRVRALAINPSNPQVIYAGVVSYIDGGLFKSVNGGNSWSRIGGDLLPNISIWSIVFDPSNPQILYAGSTGGIIKSIDGGETSFPITSTSNGFNTSGRPYVFALAVDPNNPQTLYANGSEYGINKSTDGGETWSFLPIDFDSSTVSNLGGKSIAIDPVNSQTIYVGASGGGIFKSEDGGLTWSSIRSEDMLLYSVYSLVLNPTDPKQIYAGLLGGSGIFKSTDSGSSWVTTDQGIASTSVYSVTKDPLNLQIIYVATQEGVLKSTDDGITWNLINTEILSSYSGELIFIDLNSTNTIYLQTNESGIQKSTDGGQTWADSNSGLTDTYITHLVFDSSYQTAYAVSAGQLFKSTDGCSSWAEAGIDLQQYNISIDEIVIHPDNSHIVYVGGYGGVFKTTDGGISWSEANNGFPPPVNSWDSGPNVISLAINPDNPQILYAGTYGTGFFKSTDGGDLWSAIDNELISSALIDLLEIDPAEPQRMYAGTTYQGVFFSNDGGDSWNITNDGLYNMNITSLFIDPSNPRNVYASTLGGLYKGYFEPYTITATTDSVGGSISPAGDIVLSVGSNQSFTITSDPGYQIDSVSGCGGSLVGETYTTAPINADCTVTATFAPFILDTTNPISTIDRWLDGIIVHGGSRLLIGGTASDDLSGVSAVEVSVDGGDSWISTDLEDMETECGIWCHPPYVWSYDWLTPTTGGTFQVYSRAIDFANNVEIPTRSYVVNVLPVMHTLNITVNGSGRVNSDPIDVNCVDNCTQEFVDGTDVTLFATNDTHITFAGWTGDCTGTDSDCFVTMDTPKSVTATFLEIVPNPVILEGSPGSFTTIQYVYDSIASGQTATIKVKAGLQDSEDLIFDRDVTLKLEGGYDHIFTNIVGDTSFYGTLTIKGGTATISDLVIK